MTITYRSLPYPRTLVDPNPGSFTINSSFTKKITDSGLRSAFHTAKEDGDHLCTLREALESRLQTLQKQRRMEAQRRIDRLEQLQGSKEAEELEKSWGLWDSGMLGKFDASKRMQDLEEEGHRDLFVESVESVLRKVLKLEFEVSEVRNSISKAYRHLLIDEMYGIS